MKFNQGNCVSVDLGVNTKQGRNAISKLSVFDKQKFIIEQAVRLGNDKFKDILAANAETVLTTRNRNNKFFYNDALNKEFQNALEAQRYEMDSMDYEDAKRTIAFIDTKDSADHLINNVALDYILNSIPLFNESTTQSTSYTSDKFIKPVGIKKVLYNTFSKYNTAVDTSEEFEQFLFNKVFDTGLSPLTRRSLNSLYFQLYSKQPYRINGTEFFSFGYIKSHPELFSQDVIKKTMDQEAALISSIISISETRLSSIENGKPQIFESSTIKNIKSIINRVVAPNLIQSHNTNGNINLGLNANIFKRFDLAKLKIGRDKGVYTINFNLPNDNSVVITMAKDDTYLNDVSKRTPPMRVGSIIATNNQGVQAPLSSKDYVDIFTMIGYENTGIDTVAFFNDLHKGVNLSEALKNVQDTDNFIGNSLYMTAIEAVRTQQRNNNAFGKVNAEKLFDGSMFNMVDNKLVVENSDTYFNFLKGGSEESALNLKPLLEQVFPDITAEKGTQTYLYTPLSLFKYQEKFANVYKDLYDFESDVIQTNAAGDAVNQYSIGSNIFRFGKIVDTYKKSIPNNQYHLLKYNGFMTGRFKVNNTMSFDAIVTGDESTQQMDFSENDLNKAMMTYMSESITRYFNETLNRIIMYTGVNSDKNKYLGQDIYTEINMMPLDIIGTLNAPVLNVGKMFENFYNEYRNNANAEIDDFINRWTTQKNGQYVFVSRLRNPYLNPAINEDVNQKYEEAISALAPWLNTTDYASKVLAIKEFNKAISVLPINDKVPFPIEENHYYKKVKKKNQNDTSYTVFEIKSTFLQHIDNANSVAGVETLKSKFYNSIIKNWNDKIDNRFDLKYLNEFDKKFKDKEHKSITRRGLHTPAVDGKFSRIENYQGLSSMQLMEIIQTQVHPLEVVNFFAHNTIAHQLNDITMGKIWQYKGDDFHNMMKDAMKRSIQTVAPHHKLVLDTQLREKYNTRAPRKSKVVYFTDPEASEGLILGEAVDKDGNAKKIDAKEIYDGAGFLNPIVELMYRASYGGRYSQLEHGIQKLIGVNIDYNSGNNSLVKYAVTPITTEMLEAGSYRLWNMMKIMLGSYKLGNRQNGLGLDYTQPINVLGNQIVLPQFTAEQSLFDVYVELYNQLKATKNEKFVNEIMLQIISQVPNSQGEYDLKDAMISQVVPISSVKVGKKNVLNIFHIDNILEAGDSSFIVDNDLINEIDNSHLGMQLNAVHEPDNNSHANPSQLISQLMTEGMLVGEVNEIYNIIADQTATAMDMFTKLFANGDVRIGDGDLTESFIGMKPEQFNHLSQAEKIKYFVRALVMRSKKDATSSLDLRMYEKFKTMNFSLNEPEVQKAISNSINSYVNKRAIAVDFPGGNFIWQPSSGLIQTYNVQLQDGSTVKMLGNALQRYLANKQVISVNGIDASSIKPHAYIKGNYNLSDRTIGLLGNELTHKQVIINGQLITDLPEVSANGKMGLRETVQNALANEQQVEVLDAEIILPNSYKKNFGMYEGMQPFEATIDHFKTVIANREAIKTEEFIRAKTKKMISIFKGIMDGTATPETMAQFGSIFQFIQSEVGTDYTEKLEQVLVSVARNEYTGSQQLNLALRNFMRNEYESKIKSSSSEIARLEEEANEMLLAFTKTTEAIITRIPSTAYQSFYKAKVIGFMDMNKNAIMGDVIGMIVQGYDHDVDKATVTLYNVDKDGKLPKDNAYKMKQNELIDKTKNIVSNPRNIAQAEISVSLDTLQYILGNLSEELQNQFLALPYDIQQELLRTGKKFVDQATGKIADNSQIRFDYYDPTSLVKQKKQASDGKIMVGIFANAFKTYLATYNALQNGTNNIPLKPLVFNGVERNALFTGDTQRQQVQAWKLFSEYINAATDNAKELILGPLGANVLTGNMVTASLFYGIDPMQFYTFMGHPMVKEIFKQIEITRESEAEMLKKNRFDKAQYFIDAAKVQLEADNLYNEEEFSRLSEEFKQLYLSGDEIQVASRLIMNREMPLSHSDKVQYHLGLNKYVSHKTNQQFDPSLPKFDLEQFVADDSYRAGWIQMYDQHASSFNILKMVNGNPHLMGYLKSFFTAKNAQEKVSQVDGFTTKFVKRFIDSEFNAAKGGMVTFSSAQLDDIKNLVQERFIQKYLTEVFKNSNKMFAIKTLEFDRPNGYPVGVNVDLTTAKGIERFVTIFPLYLNQIKKLNIDGALKGNRFFDKLLAYSGQAGSVMSIPNLKDMSMSEYESMAYHLMNNPNDTGKYGYLNVANNSKVAYNELLELLTAYQLIISKGKTGMRNFWNMLDTSTKQNYTKFLDQFTSDNIELDLEDANFRIIADYVHKSNKGFNDMQEPITVMPKSKVQKMGIRTDDSTTNEKVEILRDGNLILSLLANEIVNDTVTGGKVTESNVGKLLPTNDGLLAMNQKDSLNSERVDKQFLENFVDTIGKKYPNLEFEILNSEEIASQYPGQEFYSGFIIGNKVIYNYDKATIDTPFHEIAHPVVASMKEAMPEIYAKLLELAAKDTGVVATKVRENYKELPEEDMLQEIIVQYIGMIGANNFSTMVSSNVQQEIKGFWGTLKYLFDKFVSMFSKKGSEDAMMSKMALMLPEDVNFRNLLKNLSETMFTENMLKDFSKTDLSNMKANQKGKQGISGASELIELLLGPEKKTDNVEYLNNFTRKVVTLIQAKGNVELANKYLEQSGSKLKIYNNEREEIENTAFVVGDSYYGSYIKEVEVGGKKSLTLQTVKNFDDIQILTVEKAKELGISENLLPELRNIVLHTIRRDGKELEYKLYDFTKDSFIYSDSTKRSSNITGAYLNDGEAKRKGISLTGTSSGANLLRLGIMAMEMKKKNPDAKILNLYNINPRKNNVSSQNDSISMSAFLENLDGILSIADVKRGMSKDFYSLLSDKKLTFKDAYKPNLLEQYASIINRASGYENYKKDKDYEFYESFMSSYKSDKTNLQNLKKILLNRASALYQRKQRAADGSAFHTLQSMSTIEAQEYQLLSKLIMDIDNIDTNLSRYHNPNSIVKLATSSSVSQHPFIQKFNEQVQIAMNKMSKPFWDYKKSFQKDLEDFFKANDTTFNITDYAFDNAERFFENLFVMVDGTDEKGKKVRINTYRLKPQSDSSLTTAEKTFLAKYKKRIKDSIATNIGAETADLLTDNQFYVPVIKSNVAEMFRKGGYKESLTTYFNRFGIDPEYGFLNEESSDAVDKFAFYHGLVKGLKSTTNPVDTEHLGYKYNPSTGKYTLLDASQNISYSMNMENMMDLYAHNSLWIENGKTAFSYYSAIKMALNYNKLFYFKDTENAEDMLDKLHQMQVQNRLQSNNEGEAEKITQKMLDGGTSVAAFMYMGFNPTLAAVNTLGSFLQNLASSGRAQVEAIFGLGNSPDLKSFTKAGMMLFNPISNTDRVLVDKLNTFMRIHAMDAKNLLNDRHKFINGKQVFTQEKAYWLNYAGDKANRYWHFLSHMVHDGSIEAYSVVNDELVYNEDLDPRFKGSNGKMLKEAHIRYFKEQEPEMLDAKGRMKFGYTINERNKIKLESDVRMGSYDNDNNQTMNTMAIGRLFTTFKKWLPSRLSIYISPYTKSNPVKGEFKLVDEYDADGNKTGKKMDWVGEESEGIFLTLQSLIQDLGKYKKLRWSEMKPYQKKNLLRLTSDILAMIVMSNVVSYGLSAMFGEDEEEWTEAEKRRAKIANKSLTDAFFHTNPEAVANTLAEPIFIFKFIKSAVQTNGELMIELAHGFKDTNESRDAKDWFRNSIFGIVPRTERDLETFGVVEEGTFNE